MFFPQDREQKHTLNFTAANQRGMITSANLAPLSDGFFLDFPCTRLDTSVLPQGRGISSHDEFDGTVSLCATGNCFYWSIRTSHATVSSKETYLYIPVSAKNVTPPLKKLEGLTCRYDTGEHWCDTILCSKDDLDRIFSENKGMGRKYHPRLEYES